ncbi:MAG: discoidin domain-containing protein, partial [Wenzhouxiangellaceae bacterium]
SFALEIDLPERIELEPMEDRTVPLRLENSGDQPLTLSLSLAGAPAGASAGLSRTDVSLAPGEVLDGSSADPVLLSLEQNFVSDQRFTLRLETAVAEVAGFSVSSSTLVSIRSAYADVVDVRVNPAALDSGATQATVRAEIVNSANTRRDVLALLEVTDAAGVVLQSLDPVPFTLTTGFEPISIDFGIVAFAPLADGAYRMRLSLLAAADTPLAGQGASGGFLVGAPVAATVEPTPILLPPGNATTTVSINVERQFDGTTGVGGIQPTDPSISRVNWASAFEGGTISTGAFLLDGVNNGLSPFSTATLANPMVLDLGEIRSFDSIHLHLWDGDDRSFRYLIEYSEDGVNYADLVDRLGGGMRGVQIERFESVDARFLRFSGDSTTNASLHFINELLVIGDETATPFVTEIIEIDGLTDSGPTFNSGQVRTLPAGIYEVRYLDGAMSPWPSDGFNGGRTWQVTVRADVPQFNKRYQIGFLEDIISRFATPQQAEESQQGARFTFYLPARSEVYFWVQDSNAGDNRGAQRIQLRQVSGANDSLIVRVQDAMTRSVLWEQTAVAEWDTWIRTSNRDCFGCHIQTQGSSGLAIAKQKIPSLPLDNRLTEEFIDAYQFWLAPNGRVVGTNRHDFTRTALWAWAVSNFDDVDIDTLKVPLLRALDWLENLQQADGAWTADHTGTAAENVYRDGVPTATHTAGNIQALARAIDLIEAENEMPFTEVSIDSNQVDMQRNISDEMWLRFAPLENVTGLMLTISDTFASNSNFVINEFDTFNGDQPVLIDGVQASRNQSGFNILESINDIRNNTSDGWAVGGNTIGSPPSGLWRFDSPRTVDRVRVTQIFGSGHQLETFTVWYTTDPNPTLASTFIPLPLERVGLANLGERQIKYQASLEAASAFFTQPGWDFRRNIRSAAQTIFGLNDAL